MKKIFLAILLFLSYNLFGQSTVRWWFTPKQNETIDSLKQSIDSLGTISLPPLQQGRLWIGDAAGYPASRTMSGDGSLDYLGVFTLGNLAVTNAKVATGIDATKIGTGSISNTEFGYLDGLTSNIQTQINNIVIGSGLIAKDLSTKQTSTSEIYFSEDGIRYVPAATSFSTNTKKAGIPAYTSNPSLTNLYVGDIYYLGGQTDTDGSGLPLHTIKLVGLDQDYNRILLTYWDASKTQRAIDDIVTYNEAPDSNNSVSYLDFSNKNVVTAWFGTDVAQTIEVINYEPRMISCFVQSQEGVTFDFNGKTVEYADRIALPAFTDQKVYLVTMIYSKNKVYVSYVEYGSAL